MFDIKKELKELPEKPGVYIMKDENDKIIYIGKAVVLKNRVRQYFQNGNKHSKKVEVMVSRIKSFEYIVTDNELEALILECNLIKRHRPKFNVLLKDDKNYPCIKITMYEDFPRVFMTRKIEKDGAKYFGPFMNMGVVNDIKELIKKLFPIRTCRLNLPKDIGKRRPCLYYHIKKCVGPCNGEVSKEEYNVIVKQILAFLSGKYEDVIEKLEIDMKKAAQQLDFEKATLIRDQIFSVKNLMEKQKVLSVNMEDQDIISYAKGKGDVIVEIFFVRGGKLIGREHYTLAEKSEWEGSEIVACFIEQYYSYERFIPSSLIIREEIENKELIEKWLSEKSGSKVEIKIPKRGEKLELLDLVERNAKIELNRHQTYSNKFENALNKMCDILKIGKINRIEAYDISNTGKSENVGGMIVFQENELSKKDYRKFKVKSFEGQNDYGSMQEVLYRRLKRLKDKENNEGDNSFSVKPDLILIDGGIGHIKAIKSVMDELDVKIPLLGMVKNENHKTKALIDLDGKTYDLAEEKELMMLIYSIQEEVHRFAIEYNKKLRQNRIRESVLDNINGVGNKKKNELLKHFGSVKLIKQATLEQLQEVKLIDKSTAKTIFEFFKNSG